MDEAAQGRGSRPERAAEARRRHDRLRRSRCRSRTPPTRSWPRLTRRRATTARCRRTPDRSTTRRGLTSCDSHGSTRWTAGGFTQSLLIDYMNDHPDECAEWDVVFSDRGHFTEPHTGRDIGLGTLAVREYVESYVEAETDRGRIRRTHVDTHGPGRAVRRRFSTSRRKASSRCSNRLRSPSASISRSCRARA